jgi:hypothetical protein
VKPPLAKYTRERAVWTASLFLKERRCGIFPGHLSAWSGMTQLESDFALRSLVTDGDAIRRKDGRFFLSSRAMELINKQEQQHEATTA